MYFLSKFCCICMKNENILKLSDKDNDGITHIYKLTSSIAEMDFKEMTDIRFICKECCTILNAVYHFRKKCLRSKTNLISYVSQLQTFGKDPGILSVQLKDIHPRIKVETQNMETKQQNETTSSQSSTWGLKDVKQQENIYTPIKIKKEYNNEEYDFSQKSNIYENEIDTNVDVKQEQIENMNMSDDNYYDNHVVNFVQIDVKKEHFDSEEETIIPNFMEDEGFHNYDDSGSSSYFNNPYINGNSETGMEMQVKKEPMSVSETPQDGSTSQYQFGENASLAKSTKVPTGPKRHECEYCHRKFSKKRYLTVHVLTHTGEKPFECDICTKKFIQSSHLVTHMRIHTGEKPFECEVCQQKFAQSCHFALHMRTHTGVKPYECKICKNTFSQKRYLTVHMQTHTGERPYECEICKKRFAQSCHLVIHMRIHTGERPYECEVCKKAFTHAGALTIHMRIHTGERPYVCTVCKKAFNTKSYLTTHMKIHSIEREFECEICQKAFSFRGTLITHMRTHEVKNVQMINLP